MKILIINYYFEPFVGAHAYRWSQIAKLWASAGHEVDVIAGRVDNVRRETRDGVSIERIGFVKRHVAASNSKKVHSGKIKSARSAFITLLKKVNRFFFWPDGLWHWLAFLSISLFKRRHAHYDLIVSYSPTFSAHIGGLIYKKLNKRRSQWIADYGDPFSLSESMPPNNLNIYRNINYWFENIIIESASLISFTNIETKNLYIDKFPNNQRKITCIPHAVDIETFYSSNKNESQTKKFIYVGGFHAGIREPYKMLEFFNSIHSISSSPIELHIYGPLNSISIDFSGYKNIFYHGVVKRHKAIEIMKDADYLVNVENANCPMTPSKLVEYIATGNPIINFLSADDCSDIFKKYSASGYLLNVKSTGDLDRFMDYIENNLPLNPIQNVKEILEENNLEKIAFEFLSVGINKNDPQRH